MLSNAIILYARTPEDEAHFLDLQEMLRNNLADSSYTYKKAVSLEHSAEDIYSTLTYEGRFFRAKSELYGIHKYLSSAVAFINGTYADNPIFSEQQAYSVGAEDRIYGCPGLLEIPDGFFRYAGEIISAKSIDDCKSAAEKLIRTTKSFLENKKIPEESAPVMIDFDYLAEWYQEMSLTWRRLRYFTENGLIEKAYCDASYLQYELISIASEFGIPEYSLIDSFDACRPEQIRNRADRIEQEIRKLLTDNAVKIDEFATLEDFLVLEEENA